MYGCEPLMHDKIPFTTYLSNKDYKVTLSSHIQDRMELNQSALQNNQLNQSKTKKWFDKKFVHKHVTKFTEGNLVLFSIKNRILNLKARKIYWIGPCKIIAEHPGELFDLSYEVDGKTQIYY